MSEWLIPFLAGGCAGVLSAFGVGGGSALLVYLTAFAGLSQGEARGINLLYFLPAAAAALPAHFRQGRVEKAALLPGILSGLAAAGLAAWLSAGADTELLRRLFGGFLILVGIKELMKK